MATSGNYKWARAEATRRASAMKQSYVIYRRKWTQDHIIRPAGTEAPDRHQWDTVETVNYKTGV